MRPSMNRRAGPHRRGSVIARPVEFGCRWAYRRGMPHDHPIFTQVYRVLAKVEDHGAVGRARTRTASELSGRVLIVGLGTGEDLHHLPEAVTSVVAVEPSASMRAAAARAVRHAQEAGLDVELVDAVGENLPLADNTVDGVLFAYVLCTVDDPAGVLSEADRVLKPDGTVAVLEHVAAPDGTWMRRAQRLAAPWWPKVSGGCRCDQDTRSLLGSAGFDTTGLEDTPSVPLPPVGAGIRGTLRRARSEPEPPGH